MENFIVTRNDVVDALDVDGKLKLASVKALIKEKKVNVMLGKQKIPAEIVGTMTVAYSFIITKGTVKLIESYTRTPIEAVEAIEKFLNNHTIEIY